MKFNWLCRLVIMLSLFLSYEVCSAPLNISKSDFTSLMQKWSERFNSSNITSQLGFNPVQRLHLDNIYSMLQSPSSFPLNHSQLSAVDQAVGFVNSELITNVTDDSYNDFLKFLYYMHRASVRGDLYQKWDDMVTSAIETSDISGEELLVVTCYIEDIFISENIGSMVLEALNDSNRSEDGLFILSESKNVKRAQALLYQYVRSTLNNQTYTNMQKMLITRFQHRMLNTVSLIYYASEETRQQPWYIASVDNNIKQLLKLLHAYTGNSQFLSLSLNNYYINNMQIAWNQIVSIFNRDESSLSLEDRKVIDTAILIVTILNQVNGDLGTQSIPLPSPLNSDLFAFASIDSIENANEESDRVSTLDGAQALNVSENATDNVTAVSNGAVNNTSKVVRTQPNKEVVIDMEPLLARGAANPDLLVPLSINVTTEETEPQNTTAIDVTSLLLTISTFKSQSH